MSREQMYMIEDALEGAASASSISSLLAVLSYVFISLSLYTIAQRRGIKKAWLAWVPLLNVWILGSISDQYRYVVKGEVKSKRVILLAISLLNCVLTCGAVIKLIVSIVSLATSSQMVTEMDAVRVILGSFAFFIPVGVLGLASFVIQAMALYDVYSSCDPANNVLYLVLSLIPGISQVTKPLFLFLCRDQDKGMPPRREPVVENPAEF